MSRDLALGFQGNEKEITALRARRTHQERTLREDWPVVDGNWRHAGAEEIPCEQVREWRFLGSGFLAKQLRSGGREWELRERERAGWGGRGRESKVSAGSTPRSESQHQNIRKNTSHKESSQEKSHVQKQSLMAGLNHHAGRGNTAQHRLWARCGFYRRERLRKLAHVQ
jgi:hypothetical protein